MFSYYTPIQGAALIAGHATVTKILISTGLRTAQFLFQSNPKLLEPIEKNEYLSNLSKAQVNESEYAALLVALLLFFATNTTPQETDAPVALGSTLAVVGQIGYVWTRTFLGYPAIPSITMALVRYGGLGLLSYSLYQMAF